MRASSGGAVVLSLALAGVAGLPPGAASGSDHVYRVRDIDPAVASNPSSSPAELVVADGIAYFRATDGRGAELWRSDGTASGTYLLKDINPGPGSSDPTGFTRVGNRIFFVANDGSTGAELWKTDGTPEGTVLVKDVFPGASGSQAGTLVAFADLLIFSANDGAHGIELWKSDGTEAGTVLVKDVRVGSASSSPAQLVAAAGRVFFAATTTALGTELWSSDGTDAGTALVKDIRPGTLSSALSSLTAAGDRVFLVANDGLTGAELWKSDGTEAGTVLVRDIVPGLVGAGITSIVALDTRVLFPANDAVTGIELWTSDGTEAGTVLVKDILPGLPSSRPQNLAALFGRVYFEAQDATHSRELWVSDGTSAGTVLVADVVPGAGSGGAAQMTASGASIFFVARTNALGLELWKTDGTAAGTQLVKDIRPGSSDSGIASLVDLSGLLLFAANDGATGQELWRSDGTDPGTSLVKDIFAGAASGAPGSLAALGSRVLFAATNGGDRELWASDGTEAGTGEVKDIRPGSSSSSPAELTLSQGRVFFSATTSADGTELWASDGTSAGTVEVRDIAPGQADANPGGFVDLSGTLLFAANTVANGRELWKSDGTNAGTVLVRDIAVGTGSSSPASLTRVGALVYFVANDGTSGRELWRTDGTTAGTVLVRDIATGAASSSPSELVAVGSTVFFAANDGIHGVELWQSDGTAAGTTMVADLNPGGSSSPNNLVVMNGRVFFAANDGTSGTELWQSDGTALGTTLVADLRPGAPGSDPRMLTVSNGLLFMSAADGFSGRELWSSDGTPAGTMLVADLAAGPAASEPTALRDVNGTLFFRAQDPVFGAEPWSTDGTSGGTRRLADVNPGEDSSGITGFTPAGSQVFFAADDGTSGVELWAIRNQPPLADAGIDQTVELGKSVVLDGSLSSDPDGDLLSFDWREGQNRVGGSAQPTLFLALGSHVFTLTVRDGFGGAASDSVTVTVNDTTPPVVGVIAPRDVTLVAGFPTRVRWKAEDNGALKRYDVSFSADAGSTFVPVPGCTDLPADVFECAWTPALPATADARLRVAARDGSGNTGHDDAPLAIVAPALLLTAPNGPLTWEPGTVHAITWSGNLPADAPVRLELSRDAGATFVSLAPLVSNSGSFAWLVTGPSTASALVRLSWVDGDASDVSDAAFTINRPPTAKAGPGQTAELGTKALLDGSASSDPDGDPLSFLWTDELGAVLGSAAQIEVTLPLGTHSVMLTVHDPFGGAATDATSVKIIHTTTLTLTVTGQTGGTGSVTVTPPGSSCDNLTADATCTFTYTTEPTVTLEASPAADSDFKGWSGACTGISSCTVSLGESRVVGALFRHKNRPPVAMAGGPGSGPRNVELGFDGSSSSDPDGDSLTFAWDFGDGDLGSGEKPHHAYAALGDYTVSLVVNDGVLSSAPASVVVHVVNRPPIANAGPDLVGELGSIVTLQGTGSDPDGDSLSYEWRDESGVLLAVTPGLSVALPLGPHLFTLTVHDTPGDSGSDAAFVTVVDTTAPGVILNVPDGGFSFIVDVAAPISWSASDLGGLAGFDLFVSSDGGALAPVPGCTGLPSTATSCIWASPGPAPTADGRLRLLARDAAGNTAFTEAPFTLVAPALAVTAPGPGSSWGLGSIQTVTFAHNLGTSATFSVELSRDGGQSFELLAAAVTSPDGTSGSFDWVVTGPSTTTAVVRVVWNEHPDVLATSVEYFFIAAPFISIAVPDGAETLPVGSLLTATWNHNLGARATFRIELSRNGGTTWSVVAPSVPAVDPTAGAYDWLVTGPGTTRARLRVTWTSNTAVSDRSDSNFVIR